ncbi:hypothetical protein HPB51_016084 [Rhipicephalus microplus]|uniref:Uncharacterized protein n=1 Tax=Rhipicephalus microplus TaxID=6941 RepID=A0A9J6DID6_RHIMP|nr:hypothetical protein HPB51_016084 [Rhipicephalus microplus]
MMSCSLFHLMCAERGRQLRLLDGGPETRAGISSSSSSSSSRRRRICSGRQKPGDYSLCLPLTRPHSRPMDSEHRWTWKTARRPSSTLCRQAPDADVRLIRYTRQRRGALDIRDWVTRSLPRLGDARVSAPALVGISIVCTGETTTRCYKCNAKVAVRRRRHAPVRRRQCPDQATYALYTSRVSWTPFVKAAGAEHTTLKMRSSGSSSSDGFASGNKTSRSVSLHVFDKERLYALVSRLLKVF